MIILLHFSENSAPFSKEKESYDYERLWVFNYLTILLFSGTIALPARFPAILHDDRQHFFHWEEIKKFSIVWYNLFSKMEPPYFVWNREPHIYEQKWCHMILKKSSRQMNRKLSLLTGFIRHFTAVKRYFTIAWKLFRLRQNYFSVAVRSPWKDFERKWTLHIATKSIQCKQRMVWWYFFIVAENILSVQQNISFFGIIWHCLFGKMEPLVFKDEAVSYDTSSFCTSKDSQSNPVEVNKFTGRIQNWNTSH